MTKRFALLIFLVAIVLASLLAWKYYRWIYHPNTPESLTDPIILVDTETTFESLTAQLTAQSILVNPDAFRWVAKRMEFTDASIKEGRYLVEPATSNYDLIHKLRLGEQEPLDLVIRTAWKTEDLAGRIADQLAMDSTDLINYVRDVYLPSSTYSPETILTLFIPNTYEVYWNIKPDQLIQRMEQEHDKFWQSRKSLADVLDLTEAEVYTLASIVERETQAVEEKPTIAGVYLNRIKRNMLLQADPTVLFALDDFSIRRVLHKHLRVDSPYNTYKHLGLPPGPIAMPSVSSLDAVLKPEDHNYIFFCAKPGQVGYHAFASTLSGHLRNARAYQRWLNEEGIR